MVSKDVAVISSAKVKIELVQKVSQVWVSVSVTSLFCSDFAEI